MNLGFPHDLRVLSNPGDENKFLSFALLVVGISYPNVCVARFAVVKMLLQIGKTAGASRGELQLIRLV